MEIEHNKSAASHFVKMYEEGLKLNNINSLFDTNVIIQLHIYKNNIVNISALNNYNELQRKFTELGIHTLILNDYTYCSQFTGYNILLTMNGTLLINQQSYQFINTMILKYTNYNYVITNYILQIYL